MLIYSANGAIFISTVRHRAALKSRRDRRYKMTDLYVMDLTNQYNNTTAYQFLKSAKIVTMQAGNVEVVVTDKKGLEYIAVVSDSGDLVLGDFGVAVARLRMSDRTFAAFAKLERQCDKTMLEEYSQE